MHLSGHEELHVISPDAFCPFQLRAIKLLMSLQAWPPIRRCGKTGRNRSVVSDKAVKPCNLSKMRNNDSCHAF